MTDEPTVEPSQVRLPQKRVDQRREATDRAFAQIRDEERRRRLEKTMKLRSLRLSKG